MKKTIFILTILMTFAWAQYGYGVVPGAVVEQTDKGSINYSQGIITATGIGTLPEYAVNPGQARAMAIRAAKVDARRQLIEMVNGITLTSETTLRNRMADEVVKEKVEGVIRGAYQVGETSYLSDTSVEVTMAVSMSGISEVVTPAPVQTAPAVIAQPETIDAAPVQSGPFTGIIIDAKGLGVRPAMAPKIVNQGGTIVYGPGNYTREYAIQYGVAGYSKSLENARDDVRVKGNPMVVKAISVQGTNMTDVVVSTEDSWKMQSADRNDNILKDCRVLILLD